MVRLIYENMILGTLQQSTSDAHLKTESDSSNYISWLEFHLIWIGMVLNFELCVSDDKEYNSARTISCDMRMTFFLLQTNLKLRVWYWHSNIFERNAEWLAEVPTNPWMLKSLFQSLYACLYLPNTSLGDSFPSFSHWSYYKCRVDHLAGNYLGLNDLVIVSEPRRQRKSQL